MPFSNNLNLLFLYSCTFDAKKQTFWDANSVTRLGEISPLWQNLKVFGNFVRDYFVIGKILNLLWQFFNAVRQMFI